ncbi:iron chaperone [Mucilaginibacter sp. FT3.2]|uniref:iron chaperone n=1 Tax=Mucilaginibacter sp. FT3.2 TaxID=2723090 RepID=UPI00161CFC25|nr:DUF1801 domain-containing protein [Mucilaginibacter sp. FT3.2]MBB6231242.1 uncharacterized protein YdhG (YjbR/CyaY superfamily) [Mucilaginibacter sp. FT3.2]
MQTKPTSIDEYISGFPEDIQKILQQVRITIKNAAPGAEEKISYTMPAFTLHGILIYFAGFKNHVGLYPTPTGINEFKEELSVYKGAKGSVQFPIDKPMPLHLITRITQFMVKRNLEKVKKKQQA